jgi:multiple sugar transport system substrate-binding protein
MLNMFWAAGGELVDAAGKPVFNEGKNRQAMLDCLRLYKRMVDQGVMPSKVASIAGTGDLNAGVKMTMPPFILTGHWIHGTLPQVIGEENFKKYAMAPIPTLAKGQSPVSGAGGWTTVIFEKNPKLRAKAFDFMWEVYGDVKGMAAVAVDALPTFKDVSEDWRPTEANPYLYQATKMLGIARLRPAAAIYSDISLAMQVAIGEVILGKKTPEQALDDAWKEVKAIAQ